MTKKRTQQQHNSRWTPYLQLLRLDAPTGSWLLLWPALWSVALASGNTVHLDLYLIFITGAFVMRSAGCIINDIIDRKIDAKVTRTKSRPLASGKVSLLEAFLILFLLLFVAAFLLWNLGTLAQYMGLAAVGLVITYPFMKRITYWPQLFLGITFNWGILMGWAAVRGDITLITVMLYLAGVLWTLGYDTIYGHQDKQDDALLGLKSTALKFAKCSQTRKFLMVVYGTSALLLWIIGIQQSLGMLFFLALFITIAILFWQITSVDYQKSDQCLHAFKTNHIIGLILYLGIMGGVWLF